MYDLVIIGAGAAGYSAAIYAARSKMSVLLIGAEMGGNTAKAYEIENYPGFEKILGRDLMNTMQKHVEGYEVDVKSDLVKSVSQKDGIFQVETTVNGVIEARSVILATGTKHRHLNAKGEKDLNGKGISYCATCDGFFFKNKTVAVIGGGDSAATAGLFLGEICEKVYIVVRKDHLRSEPFWIDKLEENPKVEFVLESNVQEFVGTDKLEKVVLDTGRELEVQGVFIQIGSDPSSELADTIGAEKDQWGYIKVDVTQETNIKGVFAAGDISTGSNKFHQITTSVAEGAIAAHSAFIHVQKNK